MEGKGAKTGNPFALQGFLELELVRKDGVTKKVYKNTITNAGKQFLLDKCVGRMLQIGGDTFGRMIAFGALTAFYSSSGPFKYANADYELTNVLAYLQAEQNGLTGASTYLGLFDSNYAEPSKLVGYANGSTVPVQNFKEGTIDTSLGQYVVDRYSICKRWKYPEGVASGTIDTVAMMPMPCIKSPFGSGFRVAKLIDDVNVQNTNYGNLSTSFLPPGIPGFTGNDEILLNFKKDGVSKWKYNLQTGEMKQVPDTDNFKTFYDISSNLQYNSIEDYIIDGSYIYIMGGGTVYVADLATLTYITNFSTAYSNGRYASKFVVVNGELYVSHNYTSVSGTQYVLVKLNKGANYYNTYGTRYTDYSSIGLTLPSGFITQKTSLGMYGENYCLYVVTKDGPDDSVGVLGEVGFVFSGLGDMPGSFQQFLSIMPKLRCSFSAGSNKGIIFIGYGGYPTNGTNYADGYDGRTYIKNNVGSVDFSETTYGIHISLDNWGSNVMSFVKLDQPIQKGDTDVLYVSYGYKVV